MKTVLIINLFLCFACVKIGCDMLHSDCCSITSGSQSILINATVNNTILIKIQ